MSLTIITHHPSQHMSSCVMTSTSALFFVLVERRFNWQFEPFQPGQLEPLSARPIAVQEEILNTSTTEKPQNKYKKANKAEGRWMENITLRVAATMAQPQQQAGRLKCERETSILNGKPQSNMFFTHRAPGSASPLIESHSLAASFVVDAREAFVLSLVDRQTHKSPSVACECTRARLDETMKAKLQGRLRYLNNF